MSRDKKIALAVGHILKHCRTKVEMSQQEIADALGISRSYYCRHENGQAGMTLSRFIRFCQAVHTTPGQALRNLY